MTKRLQPVDFLPYNIHAVSVDGTLAYARKVGQTSTKLYTLRVSDWAELSSFDWSVSVSNTYAAISECFTGSSGVVFAVLDRNYQPAGNTPNHYGELWRSEDFGKTWSLVLQLGDVDGTTANYIPGVLAVSNTHGNMCEDRLRGKWYHGEYNSSDQYIYSGTVTFTLGDPNIAWTGNSLPMDAPVRFTTTGALPTGFSPGTTYWVVATGTNTFQVSATHGGAAITPTVSQSGTHTASEGARTAGAQYDQVRLMQSSDDGKTWSLVVKWNTDGSTNQVRHIHAVQMNPYNNHVVISIGDSGNQPATIDWDPDVGVWANNQAHSHWVGVAGFKLVYGKQSSRGVKVAFTPKYICWHTDASSTDDSTGFYRGIFVVRHDMTGQRRVNADLASFTTVSGWDAITLSDGSVLMSSQPGSGANDTDAYIWASNGSDVSDFTKIARIGGRQTSTGPFVQFFELPDGRVLVSSVAMAGCNKATAATSAGWGTVVCTFGGTFMSDVPETIAPVRWVNTATGSDSNNGERPSAAWATLGKALTASAITFGTRVIFSGQQQPTAAVTCAWGAYAGQYAGKAAAEVQVTGTTDPGCGPSALVDSYIATAAASGLIRCDGTTGGAHNIRLKNLILDALSSSANMIVTALTVTPNSVALEDCRLGDNFTGNVVFRARNAGGTYKALRCKLNQSALTSGKSAVTTDGTAILTLHACVLTGSYRALEVISGSPVVTLSHCLFTGYSDAGVCADAATSPVVTGHGCEFVGNGTSVPLRDLASLTWTDSRMDYNFADVQSGPSGKMGSHSVIGASTLRGSDWSLAAGSPCIGTGGGNGASGLPPFDIYGERFKNPASVGPVEYRAGFRPVATTRPRR